MCVEWWPVHHGIAGSAMPAHVPTAAVSEAADMPDEHLVRAKAVRVRASGRRPRDPLPLRCLHQITQHGYQRNSGVSVLYD